ncbi:MAG: mannose-1-phosphate guanylyltransferase [Lentimonas sp.]|jgi:mannose-1-phosphate guanylyltransferase
MKKNQYSIIMAGGIGSRFWPMSTPEYPKQFLDVLGIGKSLIQLTYDRLLAISPKENIYILTNSSYADIVLEQLPDLNREQVLCEPERKNTAPCIAYAAAKLLALNPDARMVVAPSDHLILNEQAFASTIQTALDTADKNDSIVTLGIQPTRPDTGYGYIEYDANNEVLPGQAVEVKQFREKPDLETAQSFVEAGNFYWNSGIFIWKASTILKALKDFQPTLHFLFTDKSEAYNTPGEQEMVNQCFRDCEDISIDFAVMENAKNVDLVLATFDWSDLGTWGSLSDHLPKDAFNNSAIGGSIKMIESQNCLVNLPKGKTAIIQGLDGYIVVESDDKLMILNLKDEQNLKEYLKG